ncbi:DUF2726 domain-containing protein [Acinetobacter sp. S40]|uniref:DUF2726 domain-containing protein n=1 Tax=Acinetobacter sp. S40 TaxID=2767434 RepID=UPI00190B25DA|nr:DUF2726 domain-containing protein [Acinetobacter sp. S40]MBJ9986426.1 DUF2726 domain-containing protein [Acinetobacter sp. S40]
MYYFLAISILMLISFMAYKGLKREQLYDSALKRRAVMSSHEQLFFTRLKQIFPEFTVLARVSFDALLTTKFLRTRHKYQSMVADFVVLDQNYQVFAIVAFADLSHARRIHPDYYQDRLLELAGYRVIRYDVVPELEDLREQFENDLISVNAQPSQITFPAQSRVFKLDTVSNLKV